MSIVSSLTKQHQEIGQVVEQMKGIIARGSIDEQSKELAKLVNLLAGQLSVHLEAEDKFLYPKLLMSKDLEVANLAKRFIDEMGQISGSFQVYKNKFNTETKIKSNPAGFKAETLTVFKLLDLRISKEDTQLYPLVK